MKTTSMKESKTRQGHEGDGKGTALDKVAQGSC